MLREALLILAGVLGSIKGLYELRGTALIAKYLSTLVAILLVYPPVTHVTLRKIPINFFEKKLPEVISSFFHFVVTALVVFPPFLILNHLYQKLFFGRTLTVSSFEWSLEMVVVQLFLVAFPEELFFRGYLQSVFSRFYPHRLSIVVTSLIFAASHTLIAYQWWHFAIFFPSLVFGWLREKTGGLVAPILFHASSNLLVFWIGATYR